MRNKRRGEPTRPSPLVSLRCTTVSWPELKQVRLDFPRLPATLCYTRQPMEARTKSLSLIKTRKANGLPVRPYKAKCYFGRMHHWQRLGDEEVCATCGSLPKT